MKERALQKTVSVLIQQKQGKLNNLNNKLIIIIITVSKCKLNFVVELEKKERDLKEHYESSRKEMRERAIEVMDFKRQLRGKVIF